MKEDIKIISISGKSGLFKLLTSTKSGIIAESLIDKKRVMAPFTSLSAIDEIAVYTYTEEVPLWQVFKKIAESENFKQAPSHKGSKHELTEYFRKILPEFDEDQVYVSHIKKILQWYNILEKNNLLKNFLEKKEDKK